MRSISISEPRINDRIRVPEVRLIGPSGEQVGVVGTSVALKLAQDAELDLVEVAPDARPPVAKLMDYGKFKYEADMKAREARRNQAHTVLKEIRFRLKIDNHDYETKKGHVERFLHGGDKVKVMIMFRGREQSRPEMGVRLLERLAADVEKLGVVESMPKQDGRNMTMVLGPTRKKAEAVHEQRKRAEEVNAKRVTKSEARRQAHEHHVDDAAAEVIEPAAVSVPTPAVSDAGTATHAPVVADASPAVPVAATPASASAAPAAPARAASVRVAATPAAKSAPSAAAQPAPAPAATESATAASTSPAPASPAPAAAKPARPTPTPVPKPAAPKATPVAKPAPMAKPAAKPRTSRPAASKPKATPKPKTD